MTKVSRDDLYLALAEMYTWASPEVVANMNPHQQLVYYKGHKNRTFETYEELMEWRRANGK